MCGDKIITQRAILAAVSMPFHSFGANSGAHMLRMRPELLDPFIGIDAFTMPDAVFGPHPHAGMSAVTLMMRDSPGGIVNRDTLGDHSTIHAGDLHWLQGGKGMMHEELPSQVGQAAIGLQVFVNMAAHHKQADPVAFRVKAADVPTAHGDGWSLRVVAGSFAGLSSPIGANPQWLTRVNMLDVTLQPDATLSVAVDTGDTAFFVQHSGEYADAMLAEGVDRGGDGEHSYQSAEKASNPHLVQQPRPPVAIIFDKKGDVARLQAGAAGLRGVLFSGKPLREPQYSQGPFTGNTVADVHTYIQRFQRGEMGNLAPTAP